MKKLIFIISVFIGLILFPTTAYADNPLNSTPFSTAYEDFSIVKKASELGNVDLSIAEYLSDPENPIDVKAAVINAIWEDFNYIQDPLETYCKLIYNKSLDKINVESLSADQQFCIGYMMAHYDNLETSLKYLKLAEKSMNTSFTVAFIRALVDSMNDAFEGWNSLETVLKDKSLKKDMRQDAINIVLDYMAGYSDTEFEVSQNNVMIENGKSQIIYLYGAYYSYGEMPYQIESGSKLAYAAILKDKYGIFYLKITGVETGSSSMILKNNDDKYITIDFDVVSTDTYKKLDKTISMYVGSTNSFVGKYESTLDKNTKPFLKNNEQYIPVDFICKAVGGTVKYDNKNKTSSFTYKDKTFIFTSGSNKISINNKASKLKSQIELKTGKQYITAKDFATLTNKDYIYDNGLILIADKKVKISTILDDYILDEIAWLVTKGKLTQFDPVVFIKNDKFGYKDSKGNEVIEPKFDLADDFHDGLAAVALSDAKGNIKYGIIDVVGNYVAKPIYDWVGIYSNGLIPVIKDGKAGFLDKVGNVKIPFQYKKVGSFSGGLAPVLNVKGTEWGYIDINGNLVIPYTYTDCTVFQENLAAVQIDGKWGYIDRTGKIVIRPIYDEAKVFYDGIAFVILEDEINFINMSGLTVIRYSNGNYYVGEQKDGKQHGKGVFTYADGFQYIGDFKEDEFSGKGVITAPTGAYYIGDFLANNFDGKGVYTHSDGTIEDGYWEHGTFLGNTK